MKRLKCIKTSLDSNNTTRFTRNKIYNIIGYDQGDPIIFNDKGQRMYVQLKLKNFVYQIKFGH